MIVSLNWLRDYVDIEIKGKEDVLALAERLTSAGLEVGEVNFQAEKFKDIVTARVLKKKAHPDASKLTLCEVSTGDQVFSVVCGAPNYSEGDRVVLAKIGATVYPDDSEKTFKIKKSKIRGEVSEGMLCSPDELGLSSGHTGIIILPSETAVGMSAASALGVDDVTMEIEITPQRGDCLNHIGIAREIAAIYGRALNYPDWMVLEDTGSAEIHEHIDISEVDFSICPRYMARVVSGVKIGPSPEWLVRKLAGIGIRSINNVVDITNYVLQEYGQPLHAFDLDLIAEKAEKGKKEICVRKAGEGEEFLTLDETHRKLNSGDILICDGSKPVALGGIMGGMNSEISESTRTVLIESAIFNPVNIRRTSRRLDLQTDSSLRFEKKVDPVGVHRALDRAAELMRLLASGRVAPGTIDVKNFDPDKRRVIHLEVSKLNDLLGTELPAEIIENYLSFLEFEVIRSGENVFEVRVPSFRNDVFGPADLVEEVGRHSGLDNIPLTLPAFHKDFYVSPSPFEYIEALKDRMVSLGFNEAVTYAFLSRELEENTAGESSGFPIFIANPVTEEFQVLRRSLFSGLILAARYNINHGVGSLRLFEAGRIFSGAKKSSGQFDLINQGRKLAVLMTGNMEELLAGKENYSVSERPVDFYDIKGVLDALKGSETLDFSLRKVDGFSFLHPGQSAGIFKGDCLSGFIGRLSPGFAESLDLPGNTFVMELDLEIFKASFEKPASVLSPSKFPRVPRDLALVVDASIAVGELIHAIKGMKIKMISELQLFDVFSGKGIASGKKSVGIHFTYQSYERTLNEREIGKIEKRILATLKSKFNAELRSV